MNIQTQFTTFALLCALPISYTFAAQPAADSLQAKLAAIDAMSDHEMLCKVVPLPLNAAEQVLVYSKQILQENNSQSAMVLAKQQAKSRRLSFKYWATLNEIALCDDHTRKQSLQSQLDNFNAQIYANKKEEQKATNSLSVNQMIPVDAFNYMVRRFNVFHDHATFLLAQKEKLEQEKKQLQQREQALLAENKNLRALEDGQQIEGMPNVPGGPKIEKKRRGSF